MPGGISRRDRLKSPLDPSGRPRPDPGRDQQTREEVQALDQQKLAHAAQEDEHANGSAPTMSPERPQQRARSPGQDCRRSRGQKAAPSRENAGSARRSHCPGPPRARPGAPARPIRPPIRTKWRRETPRMRRTSPLQSSWSRLVPPGSPPPTPVSATTPLSTAGPWSPSTTLCYLLEPSLDPPHGAAPTIKTSPETAPISDVSGNCTSGPKYPNNAEKVRHEVCSLFS